MLRYMASYSVPTGNGFRNGVRNGDRNKSRIRTGIESPRALLGRLLRDNQAFGGDSRARDPPPMRIYVSLYRSRYSYYI